MTRVPSGPRAQLLCPKCHHPAGVIATYGRKAGSSITRQRECGKCHFRFHTRELPMEDYLAEAKPHPDSVALLDALERVVELEGRLEQVVRIAAGDRREAGPSERKE